MKWICGYKKKGLFWFRIFGYGLQGKDTHTHALLFSERYGYRKGFYIGRWIFHFLTPFELN